MTKSATKKRSVTHDTFRIERRYDASPARVFNAWADPTAKARWFARSDGPDCIEFALDFRVGGREVNRGHCHGDEQVHVYDAHYQDIVPNQRIIYSYDMHLDETRISVSLATVELVPDGTGTRLIFTEQGAFLDGWDKPDDRERGTNELLDALGAELERQAVSV